MKKKQWSHDFGISMIMKSARRKLDTDFSTYLVSVSQVIQYLSLERTIAKVDSVAHLVRVANC